MKARVKKKDVMERTEGMVKRAERRAEMKARVKKTEGMEREERTEGMVTVAMVKRAEMMKKMERTKVIALSLHFNLHISLYF